MILQSKMDELNTLLARQQEELREFLVQWQGGLRQTLGLPDLNPMAGLFEEPAVIPDELKIPLGLYRTCAGLQVEVKSQDDKTFLVILEMPDYMLAQERLQSMSPGIFKQLFVPLLESSPARAMAMVDNEFEYHSDPVMLDQLQRWQKNFDWPIIQEQYEELCQKFVRLDASISHKDKDAAQMYYLESLFLFHILGNRIGYASDNHFRYLQEALFSLIDHTEDEARNTQLYWLGQQVDTEYREILFYDPLDVTREPEKYYLTYSSRDQYKDNVFLPKGCFLKSHR